MNRTVRTTTALLTLLPTILFAQTDMKKCGASEVNNAMLADPAKAAIREQLEREYQEYKLNDDGSRSVVRIIPVVFHVIHMNGAENISKAQILSAMDIINDDFRKLNSDAGVVQPAFIGIAADSEVEFRLAKLDPNGNCTDGITRTVSPLTFSAGDNVKDLISWNTSRYLNIWVVDNIESGAAGYAYYPGNAPANDYEGVVIQQTYVGNIGTSNGTNYSTRSLTHEIGHYLNLAHTWGSTNEPGLASNCQTDDGVSDTPNTIGTEQTCDYNQTTCGSLDNVENYMDYSTCTRMFTNGQKQRMQSALQSNAGDRNNLWTSTNLAQTGTSNGFSNVCTPNVVFSSSNDMGCEGTTVTFTDNSWGADQDASWQWNWSFPGGTPSTSTQQNPTVTYNTAGTYNVTLTITTGAGSDSQTQNSLITIQSPSQSNDLPLAEGIENSTFPNHPTTNSLDWSIDATDTPTWARTLSAAATGSASIRVNLRSVDAGSIHELISPAYDFTDVTGSEAQLTFKVAHAQKETGATEKLRVLVSKDCGESWSVRYQKSGSALATNGGSLVTGNFTPTASQWRTETVALSIIAGEPHVMVKFEATSDQQGYLYIDDININGASIGIGEVSVVNGAVTISPNPVLDGADLRVTMERTAKVRLDVLDMAGKVLMSREYLLDEGDNTVSIGNITHGLASGAYMARLVSGQMAHHARFIRK